VNLVTDFKQHVVVVFDIMLSHSVSMSVACHLMTSLTA